MEEQKYRLGNQPEEYALKEDYLGWIPKGADWLKLRFELTRNTSLTIINPENGEEKTLFLHHFIINDAFPLSFWGEERANDWDSFAIVSDDVTSEQFIIPLH